jgi:hypothetical protein
VKLRTVHPVLAPLLAVLSLLTLPAAASAVGPCVTTPGAASVDGRVDGRAMTPAGFGGKNSDVRLLETSIRTGTHTIDLPIGPCSTPRNYPSTFSGFVTPIRDAKGKPALGHGVSFIAVAGGDLPAATVGRNALTWPGAVTVAPGQIAFASARLRFERPGFYTYGFEPRYNEHFAPPPDKATPYDGPVVGFVVVATIRVTGRALAPPRRVVRTRPRGEHPALGDAALHDCKGVRLAAAGAAEPFDVVEPDVLFEDLFSARARRKSIWSIATTAPDCLETWNLAYELLSAEAQGTDEFRRIRETGWRVVSVRAGSASRTYSGRHIPEEDRTQRVPTYTVTLLHPGGDVFVRYVRFGRHVHYTYQPGQKLVFAGAGFCTAGFLVFEPHSGDVSALTAAHCASVARNGVVGYVGPPFSEDNGALHFAKVAVPWARPQDIGVLRLQGFDDNRERDALQVIERGDKLPLVVKGYATTAQLVPGTPICHAGFNGGADVCTQLQAIVTNVPSARGHGPRHYNAGGILACLRLNDPKAPVSGDSGGPWYTPPGPDGSVLAVGITSGTFRPGVDCFVPIEEALKATGYVWPPGPLVE